MPDSDRYTVLHDEEHGGFLGSGSYGAVHKVKRTSDGMVRFRSFSLGSNLLMFVHN